MKHSKELKILKEFEALLEMIEPGENYSGGTVSYSSAKEILDLAKKFKLERDRLQTLVDVFKEIERIL